MKYLIIAALFLVSCEEPKTTEAVASHDATIASVDSTVASADQTTPKPLTLKEKLSIAAKDFEKLETSYLPFCKTTPKDLNLFYTTLFYEMVRHESGFKSEEAYYECAKAKCYYSSGCFSDPIRGFCRITSSKLDGGFAVSRGLFQLSVSSSRGLGCSFINKSDDLHNEDLNIRCALHIYKNYILEDKVIAGKKAGDKWASGTRFWAVLRPEFDGKPRQSYVKINAALNKLEGCN